MATIQPQRRSLAEIKAKLLNPATTSHFQVNIGSPSRADGTFSRFLRQSGVNFDQDQLNISCSDASLPGSRLATSEILNDFPGVRERHVYRRLYDDAIQLSFYTDADQYLPIRYFEAWMNYITNETTENIFLNAKDESFSYRMKFPNTYKGSLEITKFEKNIDSRRKVKPLTYQFVNVFPLSDFIFTSGNTSGCLSTIDLKILSPAPAQNTPKPVFSPKRLESKYTSFSVSPGSIT